jgi:flagellar biosynthesis/type III secretory pathway M-ring protein FliF/YscJ
VLGTDLGTRQIFLLGVAAAAAIVVGLLVLQFAARRSLKRRRERKQLNELSEKLDAAEAERHDDDHGTHRRD